MVTDHGRWLAEHERRVAVPLTLDEISSPADGELDERIAGRLELLINGRDATALRAADPDLVAYYATLIFEQQVGNGGLH